jgi:hypothetical protein
MKALRLSTAAVSALAGLAPASALAQQVGPVVSAPIQQPGGGSLFPGSGSLFPTPIPPQSGARGPRGFGRHHGSSGVFVFFEEPEAVQYVVVHDQPPATPPSPPPPPAAKPKPREPYVIGRTYKSLPGGCLKMVQGGASYFHCGEGWYRQVGSLYRAVPTP